METGIVSETRRRVSDVADRTVAWFFNTLTTRPEREALEAWSRDYTQSRQVIGLAHDNLRRTGYSFYLAGAALAGGLVLPTVGVICGLVAFAFLGVSERKRNFISPALPVIHHTGELRVLEAQMRSEAVHTAAVFRHPEDYPPECEIVKKFWDKIERNGQKVTKHYVALARACRRYDEILLIGAPRPPIPRETTEQLEKGGFSFARTYGIVGPFINS